MPGLKALRKSKIRSLFRSRSNSPSRVSQSPSPVDSQKNSSQELSTGVDVDVSPDRVDTHLPTSSSITAGIDKELEPLSPPVPVPGNTFLVDHWKYATLLLSDQERELLRLPIDGAESISILADLQRLTAEKQKVAQDKTWIITFRGRRIALKDVLAKMASWLKSFEAIGDYLVSLDPGHAALPWAAAKVLLQVAAADQSQMGLLLIGLEQVVYLTTRCKIYERLYLDNMQPQRQFDADTMKDLSQLTVQLYGRILSFLAHYIRLMNKNGVEKALHAFLNPDEISDKLCEIGKLEAKTSMAADLCQKHLALRAMHQANENFQEVRKQLCNVVACLDTDTLQLWKTLNEDERVKILQWISDIPYESDHYTAKGERIEGTGEWLMQHGTYNTWRDARESTVLWLNGIPGAGKTKLSSKVVDDLLQVVEEGNASDTGFAYFYADRNRADHQDPVAILRSLVRQLCAPRDASSVDACVEDKYKERKRKGFAGHRLVAEECHELLFQLVRVQRETYLVIDGLDECNRETRHVLMNILDDLADKSGRPIKIYIASRSDQDLRSRYQGGAHLEVTANDNQADIEKFVIEKMKQSKFCCTKMTPTVREQVLKAFQDKSQGMFQWAVLHIDELLALKRNNDILKYLHRLPRGLEAAYDKILQNISNQTGSKKDVAFAAFKIAMVSRRPLSPYEMVAAVVQDPGMDFCIDEDVDIEYLLEVCHNLLIVTDGSLEKPVEADRGNFRTHYNLMGGYQYQIIDDNENTSQSVEATRSASYICRFSHLSVQEYLESKHWSTQESEAFMAGICLRTLLSFRISDNPSSGNLPKRGVDTANENDPSEQTILWVAEVERKTKLQVIWDPGCHDENKMTFPEQLPESRDSSHLKTQPVKSQPPPFQCFVELVDVRSNKDDELYKSIIFNPYIEGRRNSGVGGWAAYASQTFASHVRSAVHAKGLDPTTSGLLVKFTGTPGNSSNSYRAWTVFNQNNYDAAKRRPSAPLGSRDMFHSRPLLRPPSEPALGCALLGLEQTLQAWLEEGSLESIVQNERGDSLLALAIESEHTRVCDLLLKHGASPNMKDSRGMNPLDIAVRKRNEAIVTALLKAGAHPNLHSSKVENNPLITAVKLDDIGITRELLQHGADISLGYQKMSDRSPLVLAVGQSNVDLVALLLEHVHNLSRREYQGIIRRALEETFKVEQDSVAAILKLLMPHATELKGLLTLRLAVLKGNWALAEALIGLRVDVNARNDNFNTPLLYIVHQDCEEKPRKLKQLIDWGANVNAVDSYGQSALHVCINQYSDHSHKGEDSCGEVISLLLDNGADPNAADKKGTPLFVAACLDASVPLSIIRMLINTGADLNKAAGAERHFMTPLDAAELRIAPDNKAGDGLDETPEIDGRDSDNKEAPGYECEDQEREARFIQDEARCSTIPVATTSIASAIATEEERSRERRRRDYSNDGSCDRSPSHLEEADKYYREYIIARKIASDEIRSQDKSPDMHCELLDILRRAGAKYSDESLTEDSRAAWRKAMQKKLMKGALVSVV